MTLVFSACGTPQLPAVCPSDLPNVLSGGLAASPPILEDQLAEACISWRSPRGKDGEWFLCSWRVRAGADKLPVGGAQLRMMADGAGPCCGPVRGRSPWALRSMEEGEGHKRSPGHCRLGGASQPPGLLFNSASHCWPPECREDIQGFPSPHVLVLLGAGVQEGFGQEAPGSHGGGLGCGRVAWLGTLLQCRCVWDTPAFCRM